MPAKHAVARREVFLQPQDLPEQVREIIGLIGLLRTLCLVEALGGTTFPVPARAELTSARYQRLADLVGFVAAQRLVERYAATPLYIPSCAGAMRAARDRAIQAEYGAGAPVRELARLHRLSERQIWRILKKPEPAGAIRPGRASREN